MAGAQRQRCDPRGQHECLVVDRADVAVDAGRQGAAEGALAGDALELAGARALDDLPGALGVVGRAGRAVTGQLEGALRAALPRLLRVRDDELAGHLARAERLALVRRLQIDAGLAAMTGHVEMVLLRLSDAGHADRR